jgi:hypothetical protein
MDLFEETLFPTASPMTLKPDPSAESVPQHTFIFHDISLGESRIREETRRQWESLKPLIQRIYIDENKPFPYLAKILREEHDFEPT